MTLDEINAGIAATRKQASTLKDAFLVTGNGKHFPVKPFIVTPAELVNLFLET